MTKRGPIFWLLISLCGFGVVYYFAHGDGPLMKCDPVTLRAGEVMDDVRAKCGDPVHEWDTGVRTGNAWYPLNGDTRNSRRGVEVEVGKAWAYGSPGSVTRNVNLYFKGGKLEAVQIYGDGR